MERWPNRRQQQQSVKKTWILLLVFPAVVYSCHGPCWNIAGACGGFSVGQNTCTGSGVISITDKQDKNVYQATSKILVNQGLADKDFEIEFPTGTRVYNKINDKEYVVKVE